MTLPELIDKVRAHGGVIWVDGDRLELDLPPTFPDNLIGSLKEHKAEAIEYLTSHELFRLPFPMGYGGLPETQVVAAEGWNDAKGFADLVDRRINTYGWFLMDDSFAAHPLYEAVKKEYSRLWHEEYPDGDCGWCESCEITDDDVSIGAVDRVHNQDDNDEEES